MGYPAAQYVSESFVKPKYTCQQSKQPLYLSPSDVRLAFEHYMKRGFVFAKPPGFNTNQLEELLQELKESLSLTLVHFYPLAGRLAIQRKEEDPSQLAIYIDCGNTSPGARFIRASLDLTMDDILSPTYIPETVRYSLFDHGRSFNYDGRTESLLTIQVTELINGFFIGCSMNHMVGDGTSLWHFLSSWSEICRADRGKSTNTTSTISRPPIHDRLFPRGQQQGPFLRLPVLIKYDDDHHDQPVINRDEAADMLRGRIFHFSSETVRKLKAKANAEHNSATSEISSLQAISAHMWRCMTRAWNFPSDRKTRFLMIANARSRSVPPVPQDSFGNYVGAAVATAGCGELVEKGLGWAARVLHEAVKDMTTTGHTVLSPEQMESRLQISLAAALRPGGNNNEMPDHHDDSSTLVLTGSPRFNLYGIDVGLGNPIAVRSGGYKCSGRMRASPGVEGGGSMDFEIYLFSHLMTFLESDKEFMETVSLL